MRAQFRSICDCTLSGIIFVDLYFLSLLWDTLHALSLNIEFALLAEENYFEGDNELLFSARASVQHQLLYRLQVEATLRFYSSLGWTTQFQRDGNIRFQQCSVSSVVTLAIILISMSPKATVACRTIRTIKPSSSRPRMDAKYASRSVVKGRLKRHPERMMTDIEHIATRSNVCLKSIN